MSDNLIAELALQLSALNALVAQQARDIGELKEFRASVESQIDSEGAYPTDLDGNPIRGR